MIGWLSRLFPSGPPTLGDAGPRDAAAFAALHAASFHRGWSEDEMERLLLDPAVVSHRAALGRRTVGFILSRRAADEAEILSVAVDARRQGSGIARALLDLNLRRLAGPGFSEVGRRQGYYTNASGRPSTALVLRRDLT
jgi:ribosomal-protein-alanine N-acetyltransferase